MLNIELQNYRRIVIKIGSSILITANKFHLDWLETFAEDVRQLINNNIEVIIVTSGAVALGFLLKKILPLLKYFLQPMIAIQDKAIIMLLTLSKHCLKMQLSLLSTKMIQWQLQKSKSATMIVLLQGFLRWRRLIY